MFNNLLFVSLAPVIIIAFYIYNRDKYEKEPFPILLKALLAGVLIVLPVVIVERLLMIFYQEREGIGYALYNAFVVAGLTEEGMKFLAFYLVFWKNKNFNEKFDGIVYAVFIALGFAAIENLLYVFRGGYGVGLIRAVTAIPAHALFGIVMGYYFGLARFSTSHRTFYLSLAFLLPFVFHGIYDFILMSNSKILLTMFIPVFFYFGVSGFKKMERLSDDSAFKDSYSPDDESGPFSID